MDLIVNYKRNLIDSINKLDEKKLFDLVETIMGVKKGQGTVFIIGNGGSSATASHFVCDLNKTILGKNPLEANHTGIKALCLSDNIPLLTAWANDADYKYVFSEQLKSYGKSEDILIVITGSGNSQNIIEAINRAKEMGIYTFGFLGFSGGLAKEILDDSILVESDYYGIIEDMHSIVIHMITEILKKRVLNEYK